MHATLRIIPPSILCIACSDVTTHSLIGVRGFCSDKLEIERSNEGRIAEVRPYHGGYLI
jgi:hypothetical protein